MNKLLKDLDSEINRLAHELCLPEKEELASWSKVIRNKLLPRLEGKYPLTVAICGGGSAGKSTLFNFLAQARLSPIGGRAGINRRVLLAFDSAWLEQNHFLETLFMPYTGISEKLPKKLPKKLNDQKELLKPGPPLYITETSIPNNLVLIDTPDFDTGQSGKFDNRELAHQALEAADLLIYIFTNSNYNNQENTRYLSQILTKIGKRKSFLVYRVYPDFKNQEVIEHAIKVARNIYGADYKNYLLGIYRCDEENAASLDAKLLNLCSMNDEKDDEKGDEKLLLLEKLNNLNPAELRAELLQTAFTDILDKARQIYFQAANSRNDLQIYFNILQLIQSNGVKKALSHFPMDALLKRFAEIWLEGDPAYIRIMRQTGYFVELPYRTILKSARWLKKSFGKAIMPPLPEEFSDQVEKDLIKASNDLYQQIINDKLIIKLDSNNFADKQMDALTNCVRDFKVKHDGSNADSFKQKINGKSVLQIPVHPSIIKTQEKLKTRTWQDILDGILAQKGRIISISKQIENDLKAQADNFRSRMNIADKARQALAAALNVLPASVAITYILVTGDPIGATGLKVKLTGLFGIKDLYALIAIPATAGMKEADRKQLESLLAPVAATWLNKQIDELKLLFNAQLTGEIYDKAGQTLDETDRLLQDIEIIIDKLGNVELNI